MRVTEHYNKPDVPPHTHKLVMTTAVRHLWVTYGVGPWAINFLSQVNFSRINPIPKLQWKNDVRNKSLPNEIHSLLMLTDWLQYQCRHMVNILHSHVLGKPVIQKHGGVAAD